MVNGKVEEESLVVQVSGRKKKSKRSKSERM